MTKQSYLKCVDCNSMINEYERRYMQTILCYGCMNYGVDVVVAYD